MVNSFTINSLTGCPECFIEQVTAIDEDVAVYIAKVITCKPHPEQQVYKSCSGILNLARKADKERLAGACRRADNYGIYNYPIIVEILAKNLDRWQDDPDTIEQELMPEHGNIRSNEYYQ